MSKNFDRAAYVKRALTRLLKPSSLKNAIKALQLVNRHPHTIYYYSEETAKNLVEVAMGKYKEYLAYRNLDKSLPLEGISPDKWVDMVYDYEASHKNMAMACAEYLKSLDPNNTLALGYLPDSTPLPWKRCVYSIAADHEWWVRYGLKNIDDTNIILTLFSIDEKINLISMSRKTNNRFGHGVNGYVGDSYISKLMDLKVVFMSRVNELDFGAG